MFYRQIINLSIFLASEALIIFIQKGRIYGAWDSVKDMTKLIDFGLILLRGYFAVSPCALGIEIRIIFCLRCI